MGSLWHHSTVNRESAVVEQCLGWVFVYFAIHVMVHGCVQASARRACEALEVEVAHPSLHIPLVLMINGTTPSRSEPRSVARHRTGLF